MAPLFLYSVIFFVLLKKRRDERMSIYILEGQEKEIDTEKLLHLQIGGCLRHLQNTKRSLQIV